MRWRKGRMATACALAAVFASASTAIAGSVFQGAPGVGDPYFPKMGNGGYDATSYDVSLVYRENGSVRTTTTMAAVADTEGTGLPLGRFDLDFRGPDVIQVVVDGAEAEWTRANQELRITPAEPIADGETFETTVVYQGTPEQLLNPDGSRDGWTETSDGAVALGEPQAVPTFLPVSDHPTDKALWEIDLRTPRELTGISNGRLVGGIDRSADRTVTHWVVDEPMASYLAMVAIGKYRIDDRAIRGVPYIGAVDTSFKRLTLRSLREKTRMAQRFLEGVAGPYPFSATGGLIDPAALGFALENQTRSYYPGSPGIDLVVHEVSHQWFGDSVSVSEWDDIWLNEGFATYMEWLYAEETGGPTAAKRFEDLYEKNESGSSFWDPPPADPGGPENLFDDTVYERGAMALQVLREEIGNEDFREVLLRWAQENQFGNASTADLYALIEDVSGEARPDSFDEWLYERGKPACGPSC